MLEELRATMEGAEGVCRYGPRSETSSTMEGAEGVRRYGPRSETSPRNIHGYDKMTPLQKAGKAQGEDSLNRSRQRRATLNRRQREMLEELGESRHVWYQMRRHGSKKQVEEWLQLALEHSTWKEDKKTAYESLRRQYLQLFQECCYHDADFVDEEMQRRRQRQEGVEEEV